MDIFSPLEEKPEDPILGMLPLFRADPSPHKINLSIGAYQDEAGHPVVFDAVREAEKLILAQKGDKEYLPILGDREFIDAALKLALGEDSPCFAEKRIVAAQTIGATGAIRLAVDLMHLCGIKKIFIPAPSWSNHFGIARQAHIEPIECPYYNHATRQIDFDKLCQAITEIPKQSAILLQGCCHNPTGIDFSNDQWDRLCTLLKEKEILPVIDFAYQGVGKGIDEDAYGVRLFAKELTLLFCTSYAKNFGMYGERMGLLGIIFPHNDLHKKIESNLKILVRGSYSSPPIHGARIIKTILNTPSLKEKWQQELAEIRQRLTTLRHIFTQVLNTLSNSDYYSYIPHTTGFFALTELTKEQVLWMRKAKSVYILENSRINIAGLNHQTIDSTAQAIIDAKKQTF